MPSPTNGSLELLTYPPVHKDIPTELYTTGVPLIAERIFSLLNPTDLCSCLEVCTTWNYQVFSVPKFMDTVYAHWRKCKENVENHHASKQMEVIVFLSEATTCYFHPQQFDTNPDQSDMFNHSLIQVHQACLAQEWVQWESKSQQETKTV